MADPETPATSQGPVIISTSSSERAPIIYFDGASCFGQPQRRDPDRACGEPVDAGRRRREG
ncbi:hypothetical protein ACVWWP_001842 [Bradyrhizobium sp. LM3.6]